MLALQSPARMGMYPRMTRRKSDADLSPAELELKKLGTALSVLRNRRDLTQADVADRLDISTQAYNRYEGGHRQLAEDKLRWITSAMGASLEELMRERAALDEATVTPFQPRIGDQAPLINELAFILGAGSDRMRLDTDALSPWAESGEMVIYDRERPPRRDYGCVVEDLSGRLAVFMFAGRDEQTARLYTLAPERRSIEKPLDQVRGIYAVRFRGD